MEHLICWVRPFEEYAWLGSLCVSSYSVLKSNHCSKNMIFVNIDARVSGISQHQQSATASLAVNLIIFILILAKHHLEFKRLFIFINTF